MQHPNDLTKPSRPFTRRALLIAAGTSAVTAPWLTACGGGGGDANTATTPGGAATSVAYGPITGFGSIIVNGVRYDDSASVYTSEDSDHFGVADLGLGMVARIEGDIDASGLQGVARRIDVGSILRGPVTNIDTTTQQLTVLGVPIQTTAATVWADLADLSSLSVDTWVEVYGIDDTNGQIIATRIETKTPGRFTVRGTVDQVSGDIVSIRGLSIRWPSSSLSPLPAVGTWVKMSGLASNPVSDPLIADNAKVLGGVMGAAPTALASAYGEVEGIVQQLDTKSALVSGIACDVSGLPVGSLSIGSYIELKGIWNADGTLKATAIKNKKSRDWHSIEYRESAEIKGVISSVSGGTLTILGNRVSIDGATITNGTAAQLQPGTYVEIKGNFSNGIFRTARIKIGSSKSLSTSDRRYGTTVKIKGTITSIQNYQISVNGYDIDISNAYVEHGTVAQLTPGHFVEVKGYPQGGNFISAYKIELKEF